MKKKGFTLIELLAVIVILAVLMVIAVPKILDVIENSRKSAAKSSAELYIDAIEKNNAISNVDSNASKIADGQNMDTRLLNVKVKGTKPKYGTISIEKGKVTNANLCIDGYNVVFENRNATVLEEPCDMENIPEYALFDGNGVDSPAPIMKNAGEKLGTLQVLTREGYEFLGWFTLKEGGDKITEETVMPLGGATYYAQWKEVKIVCKRATTLHTEQCTNSDYSCGTAGYTTSGSKGTTTITYGNDPTTRVEKVLEAGDAFDCDVDGDELYGEYDETTGKYTERFYYVSDYYNTTTKEFEDDTAVLIYYNNVSGGLPNNSAVYRYHDTSNYNNLGPEGAKKQLPTVAQWSNVSLKNTTRAILNNSGGSTRYGGIALPTAYSYEGYSSRLLTTQEIGKACGVNETMTGSILDKCNYFLENTYYSSKSIKNYGYWIENPYSSADTRSCYVVSYFRRVADRYVYDTTNNPVGVRPAIEVPKENISY